MSLEHLDYEELLEEYSGAKTEVDRGNDAFVKHLYELKEEIKRRKNMGLENLITQNMGLDEVELAPLSYSYEVATQQQFKPQETQEEMELRKRGRPLGAKNKPKDMSIQEPSVSPAINIDPSNPLAGLAMWIEQVAKSGVNEAKVREIVADAVSSIPSRKLEIKVGEKITTLEGIQHYYFPLVLKCIAAGVNLAITGPAATSKTTMAVQAAKALGKEYMIFRPLNMPSQAEGYMSAVGEYIASNIYRAHKAGHLAIFDEFDASDPAITLVINSILDNKTFTYPNGETICNPEFQVICTMNTKGTGADRKYVGRNRLDAATLDRFCVLEVKEDNSLEASLVGIVEKQEKLNLSSGGSCDAQGWLNTVRTKRASYKSSHPDKIVSMRATRDGIKLIQQGIGRDLAIQICIEK